MERRVLLGLLFLVVLLALCLYWGAPRIQQDIRDRSVATATDAGYDASMVSVSGRDVRLTGTVASEAEKTRLLELIADLRGVYRVDDRLTVDPHAGSSVPLSLAKKGSVLTLQGRVTRQAHGEMLTQARSVWGAGNVIDNIDVDPSAPGWNLDLLGKMLDLLQGRKGDLGLDFFGDRLEVSGELLSALGKQRLLGRLQEVFPELEVSGDGLVVRPASNPLEQLQVQLDAELADRVIEFETGSDSVTAAGREVLDSVLALLDGNEARVIIAGHTDSTGDFDGNMALSRRRAEAVKAYFVDAGLPASRFETSGYGSTRPIADNNSSEGRSRNRRTEFDVLEEN